MTKVNMVPSLVESQPHLSPLSKREMFHVSMPCQQDFDKSVIVIFFSFCQILNSDEYGKAG